MKLDEFLRPFMKKPNEIQVNVMFEDGGSGLIPCVREDFKIPAKFNVEVRTATFDCDTFENDGKSIPLLIINE